MCTNKLRSVDYGKAIGAVNSVRILCEECHRTFSRESDAYIRKDKSGLLRG